MSTVHDVIDIVQQYGPVYGPLVIAVAFFIWRDWRREQEQRAGYQKLEQEFREVLVPLVKTCSEVIAKNSVIMERNTEVMEDNCLIMRHLAKGA